MLKSHGEHSEVSKVIPLRGHHNPLSFTCTALSCVQGHGLRDTASWNVMTTVRLLLQSSPRSFTKPGNFYLNLGSSPETLNPSSYVREDWNPGYLCQTTQIAKYYNQAPWFLALGSFHSFSLLPSLIKTHCSHKHFPHPSLSSMLQPMYSKSPKLLLWLLELNLPFSDS